MSQTGAPIIRWGERTQLLGKRLAYVFSLDLDFPVYLDQVGPATDGKRLRARVQVAKPADDRPDRKDPWDTFHVLNDDLLTTVDGGVHDVPLARVMDIDEWILLRENGVADLDGRIRLKTNDAALISMTYTGALNQTAGSNSLLDEKRKKELVGSAFLAARFDTPHPKYRWLAQFQLAGFGRFVAALPADEEDPPPRAKARRLVVLRLTFDLYSGG